GSTTTTSSSGNPAASSRRRIASAAAVLSPSLSVVLIATSSESSSRASRCQRSGERFPSCAPTGAENSRAASETSGTNMSGIIGNLLRFGSTQRPFAADRGSRQGIGPDTTLEACGPEQAEADDDDTARHPARRSGSRYGKHTTEPPTCAASRRVSPFGVRRKGAQRPVA